MAPGDVAGAAEFLRRPAAAGRVVGIAQQQDPVRRIGTGRFQHIKVHRIGETAVRQVAARERGGHDAAAIVADRREEAVVDRRLDDHAFAGRGQRLDDGRQRRHHAGGVLDPIALQGQAVPLPEPADHRFIVGIRHARIAEDAVLHALAQRVANAGRRLEIHIRHPERNDAVALRRRQDDAFRQVRIPFVAAAVAPVDGRFEIERSFHGRRLITDEP